MSPPQSPLLLCSPASLACSSMSVESCATSASSASSAGSMSPAELAAAGPNGAAMIPRLIERLDRKLVVMKQEHASLSREFELNESNGRKLFELMKQRLTVGELDKVTTQASEIDKVTKLILSLKTRLRRVEGDLKQRHQQRRADQQQQQPALAAQPPSGGLLSVSEAPQLRLAASSTKPTTDLSSQRNLSDPTSSSASKSTSTPTSDGAREAPSSASSDSINFNSSDSAIGSTINGHGGSQTIGSSAFSSSDDRSTSSRGSISTSCLSSVTSSPPLVSPSDHAPNEHPNSHSTKQQQQRGPTEQQVEPLTDLDILQAKHSKLVGQLEEAHELEDCILTRNKTIIERILKKYYKDSGSHEGVIGEFRQFARLKSLLLKDSHAVADRIAAAESQLNELKQSPANLSRPETPARTLGDQ